MAINLEGHYYYKNGEGGHSSVIGCEAGSNRVLRVNFTTGDVGATSISISTSAGCIENQSGVDLTKIPFYVTTSPTSHANANEADGYAVTGYITGSSGEAYSGSANVILQANTTYYIWFFPPTKKHGWSYWHRNTYWCWSEYEISGTSKFTLSISAGIGSSITVNRTSSSVGLSTGNLENGAEIYKNDMLKISFTPLENYAIKVATVNDEPVISGNTHTVSGDVNVSATAQILASDIGASDANIESVSTIIVTKYNPAYYHTLQYSFEGISGYITSAGGTSTTAEKFSETSVAFLIPPSFYAQIPNAKTGECTITCRTYSNFDSDIPLGNATTCKFTVTASPSVCSPIITATVQDANSTTIALTGDSSVLIRYRSTALCTIDAVPKNSASILTVNIGGSAQTTDTVDGVTTATRSYNSVSDTTFYFEATDSRGYSSTASETPTMIAYIQLTCNPTIYRPNPTGNSIKMSLSGNLFRGSFGAYSNTLTLQYRWKEVNGGYGPWNTIDDSSITKGISSYRSAEDITLGEEFDYRKDYTFQIRAMDGADGYTLSTVSKTVQVNRGIPIFDWGENDFNVNVALMLNNVNILDIMYPVGAVYMHSGSTLPTAVSNVGTWSSVDTGISGIYAWRRTE